MVYIQQLFSCLQCVVPDLSYTVRSPMLDTWEGIKQLKAALWALVVLTPNSFGSSLHLLVKEMYLLLFFISFTGKHWLFKLGSESPAGGECHS